MVAGLALAALALAVAGWMWVAALQREDVAVSMSVPPRCTGSEVEWRRVGDGDRLPAMRLSESMDCRVRLRVSNHGRWPVRVADVVFPLMGRHAGGAFRVEQVAGIRPRVDASSGDTDAVFRVDRRLAAGERYEVPVSFTFRPGGCTARRALVWLQQMPQITVSAMGRAGTVSGQQVVAFRGTAASDNCSTSPPHAIGPSKQTAP